jgi:hypothetical protein
MIIRFLCSRQKIELPIMDNVQTIPPPFVVRALLLYSRQVGQMLFSPSEAVSVSAPCCPASPVVLMVAV